MSATSIITVKVQPRSRFPGVAKIGEGEYVVRVKSPPEKGRANAEVAALLAGYFRVPRSSVRIVRGEASHQKIFSVPRKDA